MNLYLLRHGQAEDHADSDKNRPLTAYGRQQVVNVAEQFLLKTRPIDRCFASPYLRAQQTAHLFAPIISKELEIETNSTLTPEVRATQLIQFLKGLDAKNVLLVSHNPLLTELVTLLRDGNVENLTIVETSELNGISLDIIGIGMGNIEFTLSSNVS